MEPCYGPSVRSFICQDLDIEVRNKICSKRLFGSPSEPTIYICTEANIKPECTRTLSYEFEKCVKILGEYLQFGLKGGILTITVKDISRCRIRFIVGNEDLTITMITKEQFVDRQWKLTIEYSRIEDWLEKNLEFTSAHCNGKFKDFLRERGLVIIDRVGYFIVRKSDYEIRKLQMRFSF